MNRQEWKELLESGAVILDGATGTNLQAAGMKMGVCPEEWILENPKALIDLQKDYINAGTNILYAPTFTANRIKLAEYGLEERLVEINHRLVALSKEAAEGKAYIAGDISMTGQQLYPIGEMQFEELVEIYKEQAMALVDAGVDLFAVETMMSLQECRAAVIAIKECCDLPIMVSLTYEETGRTLFGTDPATAVCVLQELGADVVGINCSTGPDKMVEQVKAMYAVANVPILVKPNAGLPKLVDGKTVFDMEPEEFALAGRKLAECGAAIFGGCCGTTPAHIQALKAALADVALLPVKNEKRRMLASERKCVEICLDGAFTVVGERINPTGKKKLQEELKKGSLAMVCEMAEQQEKNGAAILDINMGMNGIDEKAMMLDAIYEVTSTVDLPLCIDSSHVDIIEEALRIYPGRALINSISLEAEKFEKLIPIAKKYGAMFILLPLSDAGLPETMEEKHQIIEKIVDAALAQGMSKEDIIVDGLVATVGANPKAAVECLETIAYCKANGLATICGLSNISFGLPERSCINTAFLTAAITKGLTMAIANPAQEALMDAAYATDLLLNKEGADLRYITRMNSKKEVEIPQTAEQSAITAEITPGRKVFDCVVNGNKGRILAQVDEVLAAGELPEDIISTYLIPGINHVGELFEKQVYFLPQLISSAAAMQTAITYLEPMIKREEGSEEKAVIIMATVEGDIHDIGKNLVVLMLKNYGYHVIDLGKDVKAETIVQTALEQKAKVIGLSALMTTTMMRMRDVVVLAKEMGCDSKIVIGGAATTESFAEEIGADGYSKDAADCVRLVERLLK
ncbi:MAG: homocysteine S-methyltransferase family protein [Lachnospiraceae bacterium]|nr:homocysteine S-methyltransferase family protein [Lachnospiraceae bacterium]